MWCPECRPLKGHTRLWALTAPALHTNSPSTTRDTLSLHCPFVHPLYFCTWDSEVFLRCIVVSAVVSASWIALVSALRCGSTQVGGFGDARWSWFPVHHRGSPHDAKNLFVTSSCLETAFSQTIFVTTTRPKVFRADASPPIVRRPYFAISIHALTDGLAELALHRMFDVHQRSSITASSSRCCVAEQSPMQQATPWCS